MKKIMALVTVLVLMLSFGAYAEEVSALSAYVVLPGAKPTFDLDSDGNEEILYFDIAYDEENCTETVYLSVYGNDNAADWVMEMYAANVYVLDINGDGMQEIFVSGDQMSCDYITFCLQFRDGKLLPVLFEDATRGENSEEALYNYGYGMLLNIEDGKVVLNGTQDILGTYFGSRTFELKDEMFVLADEGLWVFERDYMDDESWDYAGLAPTQDIPATFVAEDGAETEGVIAAGEKFMVTASDKVSVVYFEMQDGRTGYFAVEPDTDSGFGVKINGISELELFAELPYAG